jgi:pSer/pThr/pTyr-binding forkhead associated (FHA) protein
VLVDRSGRFTIEDQGSLNGTFVNRHRVDSSELEDGDELQVGKYRFVFISR